MNILIQGVKCCLLLLLIISNVAAKNNHECKENCKLTSAMRSDNKARIAINTKEIKSFLNEFFLINRATWLQLPHIIALE